MDSLESHTSRAGTPGAIIASVRAISALALVITLVLFLDNIIQRTLITAAVRLAPSHRDRILAVWLRGVSTRTLGILHRIGGANWNTPPAIPHAPGILILMNHQSLLDIPLVIQSVRGGYPQIVTRRRYLQRRYFLISHILTLYDYPLVDPGGPADSQISELTAFAARSAHPLVIFPEGHRTRDGSIGPFKRGGLRGILRSRRWQVYILVVDGFWTCARLPDFIRGLTRLRGRIATLGPLPSPGPGDDPDRWIDEMRTLMCRKLDELRGIETPVATPNTAGSGS